MIIFSCCVASRLLSFWHRKFSPSLPHFLSPSLSRLLTHSPGALCVYLTNTDCTHTLERAFIACSRSNGTFSAHNSHFTLCRVTAIIHSCAHERYILNERTDVFVEWCVLNNRMIFNGNGFCLCVSVSVFVCYLLCDCCGWWRRRRQRMPALAMCARRKTRIKKQRAHYGFESLSADAKCDARRMFVDLPRVSLSNAIRPLPYCLVLCFLCVCELYTLGLRVCVIECHCRLRNHHRMPKLGVAVLLCTIKSKRIFRQHETKPTKSQIELLCALGSLVRA